jgi:bifunctional DNA-binding transcriptional regulator/antitoxin component of YhaV-PrlF toxin-antitoxin module
MPATKVVTRLTAKSQTTIPRQVREVLKVGPGDSVVFTVEGETVTLGRAEKLDAGFLKLATESFADWGSPEADDAFGDL